MAQRSSWRGGAQPGSLHPILTRGQRRGSRCPSLVIDRWHVLKHLPQALQRLLTRLHDGLPALAEISTDSLPPRPPQTRTRAERAASKASHLRRLARVRASGPALPTRRKSYWHRQATAHQPPHRAQVRQSCHTSPTRESLSQQKSARSLSSLPGTALGARMSRSLGRVARPARSRVSCWIDDGLALPPNATRSRGGDAGQPPLTGLLGCESP